MTTQRTDAWEQVSFEKPQGGYGAITMRMKVPGGYLYNVIIMDVRGWGRAKFSNSLAFVPDQK
jgi:hypothetical protein